MDFNKHYTNTKVVSRDFISDFVARFQNMVGNNLTAYEKMVKKGMKQLQKEILKYNVDLEWYRYEITQLTNGAVSITIYGDRKGERKE